MGYDRRFRTLFENGADINAVDCDGFTAFIYACKHPIFNDLFDAMVRKRANVNAKSHTGETALMNAVEGQNAEVVSKLIKTRAEVDAVDENGKTALHIAVKGMYQECFDLLMDAGPTRFSRWTAYWDFTPLGIASLSSVTDLHYARRLVEAGESVNQIYAGGHIPLHRAVHSNNHDLVSFLISQKGARLDALDANGRSVLHVWAFGHQNPRTLRHLLNAGALEYFQDDNNETLLTLAIKNQPADPQYQDSAEVVTIMYAANIAIDAVDKDGFTALMLAAFKKCHNMMARLLACGADAKLCCPIGKTALHYCAHLPDPDCLRILLDHDPELHCHKDALADETPIFYAARHGNAGAIQLLKNAGADINIRNLFGATPLLYAATAAAIDVLIRLGVDIEAQDGRGMRALHFCGHKVTCVDVLFAHGASHSPKNTDGDTPLMLAVRDRNFRRSTLQSYVAQGVDLNIRNNRGATALYNAVGRSEWNTNLVKELLDRGADPNIATNQGATPLRAAVEMGNLSCVQILLASGATIQPAILEISTGEMRQALESHQQHSSSSEVEQVEAGPQNPEPVQEEPQVEEEEQEEVLPRVDLKCAICYEAMGGTGLRQMATPTIQNCGHILCYECWMRAARTGKQCPFDRKPVTAKQIMRLFLP